MTLHPHAKPDRNAVLLDLWRQGRTGFEIAAELGISQQRVYQIVKRSGLAKRDGGRYRIVQAAE